MNEHTVRKPSPLIEIDSLKVHFPIRNGIFGKIVSSIKAVDNVTFRVNKGDTFALVGESGCGKTTTAQAILGLVQKSSGRIALALQDQKIPVEWTEMNSAQKKATRKQIQVVFQDPYSSLNPRMTIKSILEEPFKIHNLCTGKELEANVVNLLKQVGLSEEYLSRYPHEFSGGQRQRIGIARALATNPSCIIADEPVSALDVSIQAQIINLLKDLQKSHQQTLLFISHDLAVVRHMADKLAVMYLGKIVEMGTEEQIFSNPKHPYTSLLLESIPIPGKGREKKAATVQNDDITNTNVSGCSFYPRCNRRKSECIDRVPELSADTNNHVTACFNPM